MTPDPETAPITPDDPKLTYKVICVSLYHHDLDEIDRKVRELKRRGVTRMSRSRLIRIALKKIDIDSLHVIDNRSVPP